ncbi:hypothetical protein QTH91_13765 [Variovorax dokdonensis]|uniref:Secreted protein n=1 Tax=Variovorax dokdonensis TaxID=344883 RepID=A0ABT7NC80_9BURK|nr:hypothetical protein [Variovorax dokdonensis]MDM0045555.1 hypothetical protein [Variovorax dokdonensis]
MELLVVALLGALMISVLSASLTARLMRREVQVVHPPGATQIDAQSLQLLASIDQGARAQEAAIARIQSSLAIHGRTLERLLGSLESPRSPSTDFDAATMLAAIDHTANLQKAGFERVSAALLAQRMAFERLEVSLTEQVEAAARQSNQSMAILLAAVRGEMSELDRKHLAQWQALRQSLQASHVGETVAAPGAHSDPVSTTNSSTALRDLSDEELDALDPELPAPSIGSSPMAADTLEPQTELTDEELDALPPELPAPDKPRKRVLPPPKKPPLNRL